MSKASVPEKPVVDNPRSYPWGENTGTYKLWLTLITINIIFLSVVFLINVEIPLIADLSNPEAIKGQSGSLLTSNSTGNTVPGEVSNNNPVSDWIGNYGLWVIVANIVTVWVLKTVGKWLTVVEKWCKNLCKCKWYKPWCCLGKLFCWFVTVVKWVTWVIAVASSVITTILVWVTANSGNIQG
jgi:hypothetical protein